MGEHVHHGGRVLGRGRCSIVADRDAGIEQDWERSMKYLVIGAYLAAIVLIVVYLIATIGREPDDLDGGQE